MAFDFQKYFFFLQRIGSRYYLIAGVVFFLFYVVLKNKILHKKIQSLFPKNSDYLREIFYSTTTILIFGFIPLFFIANPAMKPHTTLYDNVSDYGWFYYFLAYPIMFVMHDTYFYWTHRIMHHKSLFNIMHLVHHKSTNPSPWAAYAFHPLESIVEVGIFVVFLFTIPVHTTHIIIFFLLSIMYNIYGHLGWELYPKGFSKSFIGKWINTSVNHNQHHKYFKGNYGLYFLVWDRMMGTIRADYDEAFEEVKSR
ncbi:MAG: Delta(7)-sterol 5(6)-desaturase [Bacteroidota bacterium]|jgi:sterol desaturase/sphingolipid hydroxylase (fatty acid hydroxylase superfamily)